MHHTHHAIHQVVYILEATCLCSISINRDVLVSQCLNDKVRYYPAVLRMHAWTIRVEYPYDFNVYLMLAMVIHKKCLGTAFAFIIARTNTNRVDVAPITFRSEERRVGKDCIDTWATNM